MQALVAPPSAAIGRRTAAGVEGNRVSLLLAVLAQRAGCDVLASTLQMCILLLFNEADELSSAEIHRRVGGHADDVGAALLSLTARRHPVLLNVHGGPFTQYGELFFDEAQMQAAAGFAVVMSNPRGGSGRDTDWGQAILGPKHPVRPGTDPDGRRLTERPVDGLAGGNGCLNGFYDMRF